MPLLSLNKFGQPHCSFWPSLTFSTPQFKWAHTAFDSAPLPPPHFTSHSVHACYHKGMDVSLESWKKPMECMNTLLLGTPPLVKSHVRALEGVFRSSVMTFFQGSSEFLYFSSRRGFLLDSVHVCKAQLKITLLMVPVTYYNRGMTCWATCAGSKLNQKRLHWN